VNKMNFNAHRKQSKSLIAITTLTGFLLISLISACSPKPSAEQNAAQSKAVMEQAVAEVKKEMIAEKNQQDAASAVKAEEKSKQDAAVALAVANERKKIAAEQHAAIVKAEKHNVQNAHRSEQLSTMSDRHAPPSQHEDTNTCHNCGVVQSVREIETEGAGSPLGVVAGGIVGGVLGHQVGGGSGRDLATIAGALGGAYAGNKIEKRAKRAVSYNIIVKMNSGENITFNQSSAPDLVSGDRVRIENNVVVRR
jgi:outer membrane lipoprotein SlyB